MSTTVVKRRFAAEAPSPPAARAPLGDAATIALLLAPGALLAALAFRSGGFFPDATALAALAVLAALLVRATVASAPFAGAGVPVAVAAGGLAGLAGWVLVSAAWSDAPARALLEYDRALLYLAVLVLFGSLGRSERRGWWLLRGLAAGAVVVGVAALAVWLAPDRFPVGPEFSRLRLTWPTSYWNATGLVAGLGVVWCLGLTSALREPVAVRVTAAAAVPALAAVLWFSVSRGAVYATVAGLVVLLLAHRGRGLVPATLATAPPTVLALLAADEADALAGPAVTRRVLEQGDETVLALAGCALAAGVLRGLLVLGDARLRALRLPAPRAGIRRAAAATALAALVGAAVIADAPGRVGDAYERFSSSASVPPELAPGERLTRLAGNGRADHWGVGLEHGFAADRLRGSGAGTFQHLWAAHRPSSFTVLDAHSLYVETLAELGLVGLGLLVLALGAVLVALVGRTLRAPGGPWPALLAAVAVWALHAGVDWDWEMPALSTWVFAAGGLALASRSARPAAAAGAGSGRPVRLGVGLGCLLLAVVPALALRSQTRLDAAVAALRAGDCPRATEAALDASEALSLRPEPYEVLAYCDVRAGLPALAVRAIDAAVRRDPQAWGVHYGRALVLGATGGDPRPAARRARALNPEEPLTREAVRRFAGDDRGAWRREALRLPLPLPAVPSATATRAGAGRPR